MVVAVQQKKSPPEGQTATREQESEESSLYLRRVCQSGANSVPGTSPMMSAVMSMRCSSVQPRLPLWAAPIVLRTGPRPAAAAGQSTAQRGHPRPPATAPPSTSPTPRSPPGRPSGRASRPSPAAATRPAPTGHTAAGRPGAGHHRGGPPLCHPVH